MQVIYYGAPGTGKSYSIDKLIVDKGIDEDRVFRVTFHPEYTYNDFVGQLLPTVIKSGSNKGDITYSFQKGPFTKALEKAYEDLSLEVFLIIEEMSRGNCAGIFGDIFQLLDREKSGINKGFSKYFITNDLIAQDIIALKGDKILLPPNLSIFGTVNTSDQNVFVMDTAFKRRFDWKYISTKPVPEVKPYLNNVELKIYTKDKVIELTWVDLYGILNKFISDSSWLDLGEDKQLGQFFIEFDTTASYTVHKQQVMNKLLHYLWDDVHKASYKSNIRLFSENVKSFSDLYFLFDNDEVVFSDDFLNCIDLWLNNAL